MRFEDLKRYDVYEADEHGAGEAGEYVKFEDVDKLLRLILLKIEMLDVYKVTCGFGMSAEVVEYRQIKAIADMIKPEAL